MRSGGAGLRRAVAVTALPAVAVVLALAGCADASGTSQAGRPGSSTAAPATTAAKATVVTRFTPYAASGALSVPIEEHATGSCWMASIEVPMLGAYRCLVGNEIADPCFTPPRPASPVTVACLPDPWSGAQVVTLTEPLPSGPPLGDADNPWAVQLANGARCVAGTGTVHSVAGVALNLLCPGGMAAGGLDRTNPSWQVSYGSATGDTLIKVGVVAAWRG